MNKVISIYSHIGLYCLMIYVVLILLYDQISSIPEAKLIVFCLMWVLIGVAMYCFHCIIRLSYLLPLRDKFSIGSTVRVIKLSNVVDPTAADPKEKFYRGEIVGILRGSYTVEIYYEGKTYLVSAFPDEIISPDLWRRYAIATRLTTRPY